MRREAAGHKLKDTSLRPPSRVQESEHVSFAPLKGLDPNHLPAATTAEDILKLAPVALLVCDGAGTVTFATALAEELFHMSPPGKSAYLGPAVWGAMSDPDGHSVDVNHWPHMRALRGENISGAEYRLTRSDARTFDLLCSAVPIKRTGRTIIGAVAAFTDITEMNRRSLKARATAVINERRQIAADLHDTLSQSLSATVLHIEAGIKLLSSRYELAQHHLSLAQQSARDSVAKTRNSMWMLAETSDEVGELTSALPAMITDLLAGTHIKLLLHIQPQVRNLPAFVRAQVHAIVREAVRNILKHANANIVRIDLVRAADELHLCVHDDGVGFEQGLHVFSAGFGLASMRERTQRLGGHIEIDSGPGRGTKITAAFPLVSPISNQH